MNFVNELSAIMLFFGRYCFERYWVKHRRKPFRGFRPLLFNPAASTVGKCMTVTVVYVIEVIESVKNNKKGLLLI